MQRAQLVLVEMAEQGDPSDGPTQCPCFIAKQKEAQRGNQLPKVT